MTPTATLPRCAEQSCPWVGPACPDHPERRLSREQADVEGLVRERPNGIHYGLRRGGGGRG